MESRKSKIALVVLGTLVLVMLVIEVAGAAKPQPAITYFDFPYYDSVEGQCRYLAVVRWEKWRGGHRRVVLDIRAADGTMFTTSYGVKGGSDNVGWLVELDPGSYTIEKVSLTRGRKGEVAAIYPDMDVTCTIIGTE